MCLCLAEIAWRVTSVVHKMLLLAITKPLRTCRLQTLGLLSQGHSKKSVTPKKGPSLIAQDGDEKPSCLAKPLRAQQAPRGSSAGGGGRVCCPQGQCCVSHACPRGSAGRAGGDAWYHPANRISRPELQHRLKSPGGWDRSCRVLQLCPKKSICRNIQHPARSPWRVSCKGMLSTS